VSLVESGQLAELVFTAMTFTIGFVVGVGFVVGAWWAAQDVEEATKRVTGADLARGHSAIGK